MTFPFLADYEPWVRTAVDLALLFAIALVVRYAALLLGVPVLQRIRRRAHSGFTDVVMDDSALRCMAKVLPYLVVQGGIGQVPHLNATAVTVIDNVALAMTVIQLVRALLAMLDAMLLVQNHAQAQGDDAQSAARKVRSIKSYVQLGKLVLTVAAAIVAGAALFNRSPLIVLSGLGAMSAVLMLVFKDTILSFTAGVLLSSNDMLRLGDWIEMPQVGADGDVIDIALHTVKVQNWDKTITTIPTWRLMSESYRNFRAYIELYLRANPKINQSMTLIVRTLESTPEGVPIELYCFTASTAWTVYESTQGDIFDHLLAILPEFGLRPYQSPTGNDLRMGMAQRAEAGQALPKP